MSCHAFVLGNAEAVQAVHKYLTSMDFDSLTIWIACDDAISQSLQVSRSAFERAAYRILCPKPAERLTGVAGGGVQSFFAGPRGRSTLFKGSRFLQIGRITTALRDDGGVAAPSVAGTVGGYGADPSSSGSGPATSE